MPKINSAAGGNVPTSRQKSHEELHHSQDFAFLPCEGDGHISNKKNQPNIFHFYRAAKLRRDWFSFTCQLENNRKPPRGAFKAGLGLWR